MPNFFSRIADLSPRVSTASRKLFAIVSATVSTAGRAMHSLLSPHPLGIRGLVPGIFVRSCSLFLTPNRFQTPRPSQRQLFQRQVLLKAKFFSTPSLLLFP